MALRLVLLWISLTVAIDAALYFGMRALPPGIYLHTELVSLVALLAAPTAQGLALRLVRLTWARDWFVAVLGGLVFSSAVANLLRSPVAQLNVPLSMVVLMVVPEAMVAALQWYVLRAHVRRAARWWAVAGLATVTTLTLRWCLTHSFFPTVLPHNPALRLAIPAAAALVQAIGLAWILIDWRADDRALRSRPVWFVIEWTTGAGIAVLTIFAAASLLAKGIGGPRPAMYLQYFGLPALTGLIIGATQWWLLRDRLPIGLSWIVASMAAMAVPAAGILEPSLGGYVGYFWLIAMTTPWAFAIVGAWVGLAQWLVLRRHVSGALLWVPASALGWCAWMLRQPNTGLASLTIGVAAGLVTGIVMAFLLRRPRSMPARAAQPESSRWGTDRSTGEAFARRAGDV
jgi:hypothetical protein